MPWPISDLPITMVTVSSGATRTKALGASVRPAPRRRRGFAPVREADAEDQAAADDTGGDSRGEESAAVETRGRLVVHGALRNVREAAMLRYAPHAIGIFRSRRRSDGFLPHPAGGGPPVAARLRHDPGRPRRAGAQSTAVSVRRHHHRRGGPEPCAHRSLRPPAAAGQARLSAGLSTRTRPARTWCPILLRDSANLACAMRERASATRRRTHRAAVRSRGRRDHSAPAAAHRLRHAARAAAGRHRAGARCGAHPRLLEHRGVGERGRRSSASWCSPAISASTTRPSCRIRSRSSPRISCSWRAPTAIASTAAAKTPSASSAASSRRRSATAAT